MKIGKLQTIIFFFFVMSNRTYQCAYDIYFMYDIKKCNIILNNITLCMRVGEGERCMYTSEFVQFKLTYIILIYIQGDQKYSQYENGAEPYRIRHYNVFHFPFPQIPGHSVYAILNLFSFFYFIYLTICSLYHIIIIIPHIYLSYKIIIIYLLNLIVIHLRKYCTSSIHENVIIFLIST